MGSEFKIEVPIEQKSSGTSGTGGSSGPGFAKMASAVAAGSLASKALSTVMEGLMTILQPLTNILKALFVVVFLPLMPLVVILTEVIGSLIEALLKYQDKTNNLIDEDPVLDKLLNPKEGDSILKKTGKAVARIAVGLGLGLGELSKKAGEWLGEQVFKMWQEFKVSLDLIGTWFSDLFDKLGAWFDNIFESITSWFSTVGTDIWNIIKSPFEWLAKKITNLFDIFGSGKSKKKEKSGGFFSRFLSDAIISPGGQVLSTAPDDYLIATKNPQSLSGNGTINITITGNSFNSESDMRKMVDMISKKLAQQQRRSSSA